MRHSATAAPSVADGWRRLAADWLASEAVQTATAIGVVTGRPVRERSGWAATVVTDAGSIGLAPGRLSVPGSLLAAAAESRPATPRASSFQPEPDPYPWAVLVACASRTLLADPPVAASRWPLEGGEPELAQAPFTGDRELTLFLTAMLLAAGDATGRLARQLLTSVDVDLLHRAVRASYVCDLAHPGGMRAAIARRRAGSPVNSAWLLPELSRAYEHCREPDLRTAIADAHHRIGKHALSARDPRSVTPIRRSTHSGRLWRADQILVELIRMAGPTVELIGHLYGVDLEALHRALAANSPRGVRIRDEAVADGQTTVDLWWALHGAGVRGWLVASDPFSEFELVTTDCGDQLVLGPDGRCLQAETISAGLPDADAEPARTVPPGAQRERHRWITPRAGEIPRSSGLRLEFRGHDVFTPDPVPAHLIRVCGLLYRSVRGDVDARSYFGDQDIEAALTILGSGLVPGGVLMVGSVIDAADDSCRYTDLDLFQRLDGEGSDYLYHCGRTGVGLGEVARPRLALHPVRVGG